MMVTGSHEGQQREAMEDRIMDMDILSSKNYVHSKDQQMSNQPKIIETVFHVVEGHAPHTRYLRYFCPVDD